jgi:rfaE bifunctional protein kinase chain/domain/rfaE bifunctional protein nucleotidyltransferase chain/domain
MSESSPKVMSVERLTGLRRDLAAAGKTVVQCHGCFDIVHPGHIRYLKFARELGDVLIVSVSADEVVAKGDDRPYISEDLRMENLAALEFVDYVCLDRNDWAGPVLDALRPDIYVKGKEYETRGDPRFTRERELVESYGGKVVFSSGDVIYSSTYILSQFRERFPLERERLALFVERHGISRKSLAEVQQRWAGKRVLLLGDAILDCYIHCEGLGIASESPVLTVMPLREEWYAGGPALIAAQIAALGAEASLLTCLPAGDTGERFRKLLAGRGVRTLSVSDGDRQVAIKTRYLVEEHKVFKVDSMRLSPLSSAASKGLGVLLGEVLGQYDALIVTDFGYGLFTAPVVEALVSQSRAAGVPYFLDVSHTRRANILRFTGPRLATPTEQELRFAFADNESGLSNLASRFFQETDAGFLMITMGKRGVVLFDRPARPRQRLRADFLPAFEEVAVDPVGAGDVFLAGAALAHLGGASWQAGAYLGSALAALHVATPGNDPVENLALHMYLDCRRELGG